MKKHTFAERLEELRKQSGMSRKEAALKIGLYQSAIYEYEVKGRVPTNKNFLKIADYFNVPVDHLTGYDDNNMAHIENACSIGQALKTLRTKQHLSEKEVAEKANISVSLYKKFENDKLHKSDAVMLSRVASILGTSSDYLLRI